MSSANNVNESVIRSMTRLAQEHNAVNLSQGIPNESPPWRLRMALAHGALTGQPYAQTGDAMISDESLQKALIDLISGGTDQGQVDQLNQYSPPMGRHDLRLAISKYYLRFYDYDVSPDNITVTLGATEAFASALRTIGRPGDKCVIIEPFHELYPSQCEIFHLEPIYVSLRVSDDQWVLDTTELEDALKEAKILMFNSPHNPTGKVFTRQELKVIVDLCLKHNVYVITDEIYEHMCYDDNSHILIPKEFPEIADRTLVCNSLGKSASATGWRLGWCLHPPDISSTYRGVHDQMVVMSPHPMQYASLAYFSLPDDYFQGLADRYKQRVEKLGRALQTAGFGIVFPQGAYYLFADYTKVKVLSDMTCMEAAMYLLKSIGVACVPGDNFYGKKTRRTAGGYLRFAACRTDEDLEEAARRLQDLNKNQ
jgi:aspartate/methionine/tyrosine aminotransferase